MCGCKKFSWILYRRFLSVFDMFLSDIDGVGRADVGRFGDGVLYYAVDGGALRLSDEGLEIKEGFYFLSVTGGTASVSDGRNAFVVGKGDLLMLTPSISVTLTSVSEDCRINVIGMSPPFFDTLRDGQLTYNRLVEFFGETGVPVVRMEADDERCLKRLFSLFPLQSEAFLFAREGAFRHLCSLYLLQVANILYKKKRNSPACVRRPNEIYRHFKKLLVENYKEQHRIGFYADRLNITPTYLSRIVKKVTGRTVHRIVTEFIHAEAVRLLSCTDMDIKEISASLGFSDQSAFGKSFIKKEGVTPSDYRLGKGR